MNKLSLSLFTFFLLLTSQTIFAADPGDLDPTFGTGGKVYNLPLGLAFAEDVAIQADGKIVIVGSATGPDMTDDFGVVRLNANGTPDTDFGTNGFTRISFDENFDELATSVVIQADGKIVISGSVELGSAGWDFGIVRLNSNGTLDATYSGGKVKVNVVTPVGGNDFAFDMIIQPDQKVVIVGTTRPTPNNDIALVRLTTSGTLDSGFNGGRINIQIGSGANDEGSSLALQNDGSIIIGGVTSGGGGTGDFCLLRITSVGVLDTTFGFMGLVVTPIGTQGDRIFSIALQSDGRIVAAGTANSGSFDEIAFARYTFNGDLDTSFDGDGKATFDVLPMLSDSIRSIAIQSDGKIIGVGPGGGPYMVMRLTLSGALDPTFGDGGKAFHNIAPTAGSPHRVVLQPDGKIVAVGDGGGASTFGFTAAKILTVATPTSVAPFDFDGDGKTDIGIFRPLGGASEWWVNRSSTGVTFALQFGASTDKLAPEDYTGDGKADIAFFRPASGEWYVLRSEDFSFFALPFGTNGDVPVPADYDADGKADFAVFRPSSSTWFISQSSGAPTQIVQFGISGDQPVVADYDADGKADVGIYRPAAGEWWIQRTTSGLLALQFGNSADQPVQGDYTGDGKSDIAIWRPSTGEWLIVRSEDLSFFGFPFGTTGDTVAPGDYDGDGKFDATVFRPSSVTWFIGRSTAGTQIVQFGATGDRPIPNSFVP